MTDVALPDDVYPNKLREHREGVYLSRAQLARLTVELAAEDSVRYTTVGESTITHLERGKSRPRGSTASTLAKVLDRTVSDLFPNGIDKKGSS